MQWIDREREGGGGDQVAWVQGEGGESVVEVYEGRRGSAVTVTGDGVDGPAFGRSFIPGLFVLGLVERVNRRKDDCCCRAFDSVQLTEWSLECASVSVAQG